MPLVFFGGDEYKMNIRITSYSNVFIKRGARFYFDTYEAFLSLRLLFPLLVLYFPQQCLSLENIRIPFQTAPHSLQQLSPTTCSRWEICTRGESKMSKSHIKLCTKNFFPFLLLFKKDEKTDNTHTVKYTSVFAGLLLAVLKTCMLEIDMKYYHMPIPK